MVSGLPATNKKEALVHICPHCHKLGISTYAAIGDPFSRGLASCRYCTNVSKVRRNFFTSFIMVAALALFWAIDYFLRPPTLGFGLLWLSMLGGIALVLIDRLTEFDKYQPPTKDGDLARPTVARSENGAAHV